MSSLSQRLSYLRTLPRDVQIVIYTQALRRFSFAILNVIFPIYLSKLGASSLLIGATMTGRSLFLALRSLIEGLAADRFGRKPILLFTAGLLTLGGLVYAFSGSLPILVVSAILFSVGTVTFPPQLSRPSSPRALETRIERRSSASTPSSQPSCPSSAPSPPVS